MKKKAAISLPEALAQRLARQNTAVFLPYQVAVLAWHLVRDGAHDGVPLRAQRDRLDSATLRRVVSRLLSTGVLRTVPGVSDGSAYLLLGASASDGRALICALDPFCYLSHSSALEYHALTDRLPEMLYVSTPAPAPWREFADTRMARDLGDELAAFQAQGLPGLSRSRVSRIGHRPVHRYSSIHPGAFRVVKDPEFRVATLGRTFLDMLREPDLCGGLMHVLTVFREHARPNLRLILDEIDQHGNDIDKVRAGYILEDLCTIHDGRIDEWVARARRGGSRKLNPALEYSPVFSERWALSINIPIPPEWTT